jgi:hypothetical protein
MFITERRIPPDTLYMYPLGILTAKHTHTHTKSWFVLQLVKNRFYQLLLTGHLAANQLLLFSQRN